MAIDDETRATILRLQMLPAEQAHVDWADFGVVTVGRAERRLMGEHVHDI